MVSRVALTAGSRPATRATIVAWGHGSDPDSRLASDPPRTPNRLCTESDRPPAPTARDRCERPRQTDARLEAPSLAEASEQPTCSVPRDQVVAMCALMAMTTAHSRHGFRKAGACLRGGGPGARRRMLNARRDVAPVGCTLPRSPHRCRCATRTGNTFTCFSGSQQRACRSCRARIRRRCSSRERTSSSEGKPAAPQS